MDNYEANFLLAEKTKISPIEFKSSGYKSHLIETKKRGNNMAQKWLTVGSKKLMTCK